jgi:hypothetical protein
VRYFEPATNMTFEYRLDCSVSGPPPACGYTCARVHSLARSRGNPSLRAPPQSNTCRSHLKRIMDSNPPENDTVLLTTQKQSVDEERF